MSISPAGLIDPVMEAPITVAFDVDPFCSVSLCAAAVNETSKNRTEKK